MLRIAMLGFGGHAHCCDVPGVSDCGVTPIVETKRTARGLAGVEWYRTNQSVSVRSIEA